MPTKVFISYRRDDSKYQARMVHTAFCQAVPHDHVFMDVDSIPPGANFRKILKDWVDQCEVLLALIGPGWIDATDPKTSRRRLDNPSDFVRIEIGEALARDIPVVPVLLDGTPMPDPDLLPDDLKELVDRQAEFVEYRTFDADVERLIRKLRLTRGGTQSGSMPKPVAAPRGPSPEERYRAEGRIKIDAQIIHGAPDGWFKPGAGKIEWFRDHDHGPEMLVVPAGSCKMGSTPSEIGALKKDYSTDWHACEGPQRTVAFSQPFAVGRFPVTFDEWDACVADGGCSGYKPADQGWGRDKRPVINVNWDDAQAYAAWLSAKTGQRYRLLSEAEREYVARAGTATPFWWGSSITPKQANYDGNHTLVGGAKGEYRQKTVPVDSFEANPWGLYQVHGNVFDWCEDHWHDTYDGAPTDGSAWLQSGVASRRVVRGGSWNGFPRYLRSAGRDGDTPVNRNNDLSFRLARTLNP